MTKFLVTGQADLWNVFWVLSVWSAAYMVAAVILREVFSRPQTPMEKYGLWFGRIVGIVGASIIFAYGYRTTGELERVEQEVEIYKALAAKHSATGVSELLTGPQYSTVSITTPKGTDVQIRNIEHDRQSARSVLGAAERKECETSDHRAEDRPDWGIGGRAGAGCSGSRGIGRDSCGVSIGSSGIRPSSDGSSTVY